MRCTYTYFLEICHFVSGRHRLQWVCLYYVLVEFLPWRRPSNGGRLKNSFFEAVRRGGEKKLAANMTTTRPRPHLSVLIDSTSFRANGECLMFDIHTISLLFARNICNMRSKTFDKTFFVCFLYFFMTDSASLIWCVTLVRIKWAGACYSWEKGKEIEDAFFLSFYEIRWRMWANVRAWYEFLHASICLFAAAQVAKVYSKYT